MTLVLNMLIFVLCIGVVYGIALPLVPRTASGGYQNTTSTLAAAVSTSALNIPPALTTPPKPNVPSQWVPVPTTVEWPCYLIDNCSTWDWELGPIPPTENVFGDFHTEQPAWLVVPYRHILPYGQDYSYDSSCGAIWMTSLTNWMATAPTTLGPLVSASEVYEIQIGTTLTTWSRTESLTDIFLSEGSVTYTETNLKGVLTTETMKEEFNSESQLWASTTIITKTITGITSLLSTRSEHREPYFVSPFTFSPSAACCSTCTIFGGTVQVFNWPTPAPQPPTSILVDSKNNFTFTSPSIYVAFQSLYATNLCGTLGNELITSTTIAFTAGELSTSEIYTVDGKVTDYMDFFQWGYTSGAWTERNCGPRTTTILDILGVPFTDLSAAMQYSRTNTEWYVVPTIPGYETISLHTASNVITTYTVTHDPCSPALSVPTLLYSLQPEWTGCIPGISAFFDPPIVLTTSGSMGLVAKTSAIPVAAPTAADPKPGETAKPATPMATPTSNPNDPNQPSPQNPSSPGPKPGNSDPQPHAPAPSAYIVQGQTLSQGAPPITIAGHKCSLAPGGSSVIIDATKTVPLASFLASPLVEMGVSPSAGGDSGSGGGTGTGTGSGSTAGGSQGGNNQNGGGGVGYVFGTQTLNPGSQITVSGEVMSLASDGSSVVVYDAPTGTNSKRGSGTGKSTGTTKTEGISALIAGGTTSSIGSLTQSAGSSKQTKNGAGSIHTGHDRIAYGLGGFGGLWILGLALL